MPDAVCEEASGLIALAGLSTASATSVFVATATVAHCFAEGGRELESDASSRRAHKRGAPSHCSAGWHDDQGWTVKWLVLPERS